MQRQQGARCLSLRNHPTEAERYLWRSLRGRQLAGEKFRRQVAISCWIADFACLRCRLVIELDGGEHDRVKDQVRDSLMAKQGWRVLRFWNNDVLQNTSGVLAVILQEIEKG